MATPSDALDPSVAGQGRLMERHDELAAELRLLRLRGLSRVRDTPIPLLLEAAQVLGYVAEGAPDSDAVRLMLQDVIGSFGESSEAVAASHTFGLLAATRMKAAGDRRRAAARAQGISVERFRKGYEPVLIDQIAEQLLLRSSRNEFQVRSRGASRSTAPAEPTKGREEALGEWQLFDVLRDANSVADWSGISGLYRQCVAIASDDQVQSMPRPLKSAWAAALNLISSSYSTRFNEFLVHSLAVIGNVECADRIDAALFGRLYFDTRFDRLDRDAHLTSPTAWGSRREPTPFEVIVETARRMRDLELVREALRAAETSGVVGGSANFGRFRSIRGRDGHAAGSDVDLMVVVRSQDDILEIVELLAGLPGQAESGIESLRRRARSFCMGSFDCSRTVLSHKVTLWRTSVDPSVKWLPQQSEYVLDLRILTVDVLDWLLAVGSPALAAASSGTWRSIADYTEHGSYLTMYSRNFSGRTSTFEVGEAPAENGVVRTSRAYHIDSGDRYFPGVHQNLLLPTYRLAWDHLDISDKINSFQWKLSQRIQYERRVHPYEMVGIELSHPQFEDTYSCSSHPLL